MKYAYPRFKREVFINNMMFRGGPRPGEPMPDFDLPTTDGGQVKKGNYVGNVPLLINFASLTCPMTSSGDPVLKRLYDEYGGKMAFLTVYVREAHPGNTFPQPKALDRKAMHARILRERDDIVWPVALDDISGKFHRALDSKENAVYIMDTDGNVAFRTLWSSDEAGIREAIESVLSAPGHFAGQRQPRLIPLLGGIGKAYEVIDVAGEDARQNWSREVPPIYLLASIATLFKAFTPLWRGVMALSIGLAGITAAAAGLSALSKRRTGRYGEFETTD